MLLSRVRGSCPPKARALSARRPCGQVPRCRSARRHRCPPPHVRVHRNRDRAPQREPSQAMEEKVEDKLLLEQGGPSSSSSRSFQIDQDVTRSRRDSRGCFMNPWPTWKFPSNLTLLRFLVLDKDNSNIPTCKEVLDCELPVLEPYFIQNPQEVGQTGSGLRVTWLGHASVLVEMDDLVVLTDPVFSQRASPVQFTGPKRFRGPPCSVAQLPRVDAVLISHSHYDHLDVNSVKALNMRFGKELRWFVPLGLLNWMRACNCENVVELDWWEKECVPGRNDVAFFFTPSQHWCGRTPLDKNQVLWGSWTVLGPCNRFFFAGDTGYCTAFQEIGRCFGPFDLAAVPIGAYLPRDALKAQHVDPEEAVRIHIDIRAKHSVGIHWGTFTLACEYYLDPPVKLKEAMQQLGQDENAFFVLKHGESRLLNPS